MLTRLFTLTIIVCCCVVLVPVAARSDDTAQLQQDVNAALASHVPVTFAARQYHLSSTIKFAPPPGQGRLEGLAVHGAGAGLTKIVWDGPANQSVFSFTKANFGNIDGFMVTGGAALADLDFAGGGSSAGMQLSSIVTDNKARYSFRFGNPQDLTQVSEYSMRSVFTYNAGVAGFIIEGNNNLNFNFYNCYCSHEPSCVSNDPRPDGASQTGGNFNWFGGGASDTPPGNSIPNSATFYLTGVGNYNFVGVRVEDSGTLIGTSPSTVPMVVNWIGGQYANAKEANRGAKIIDFQSGGSFQSTHSLWQADGKFAFAPSIQAASFDDDILRVGSGPNKSRDLNSCFADNPAGAASKIRKNIHTY